MECQVFFFGDSLTLGHGDPRHLGWPGRLCAQATAAGHGLTAYNLGVRRQSAAMVQERWHQEWTLRRFEGLTSRFILAVGAVDALRQLPAASTDAAVRAMLSGMTALGPCLLLGAPPMGEDAATARVLAVNQRLAGLASQAGVPFLDLAGHLALDPDARQAYLADLDDGVHPGASGYDLLAEAIGGWSAWRAWFPG